MPQIDMKYSNILHIRILYGLMGGILLVCLGLFVSDIFSSEEEPAVGRLAALNSDYAFTITDLRPSPSLYDVEHPVEGLPEGVSAHAHVGRYDVDVYTNSPETAKDRRLRWVLVLQIFNVAAVAAIVVLVVVALVSFYRSTKRGQVFPTKNVALLWVIGLLLVALSLSIDTGTFLERRLAADLLSDTRWVPQVRYTVHFMRIFFGLTLIFLSQIIRIGRELQEEQELTI